MQPMTTRMKTAGRCFHAERAGLSPLIGARKLDSVGYCQYFGGVTK
jgi:hypothetical protein